VNKPVFSLLGLTRRAGKLTWQKEANLSAIRSGKAGVVILAGDAGKNGAKMYLDKCQSFGVPLVRFATRDELGRAIGTSSRTAVAVLDKGIANKIATLLRESSDHI